MRITWTWHLLPLGFVLVVAIATAHHPLPTADPPPPAVYFSPRGGAQTALVAEINAARHRVHVLAYCFTSAPLAAALVAAQQRGVTVEVLADPGAATKRGSQLPALQQGGVTVRFDRAHALMHDKVLIFDGETVATGSYNFTEDAERRNAENLLILHDPALAARYDAEFAVHQGHSSAAR